MSCQFSQAFSGGLSGQRSHQVRPRAQTSPHQCLRGREKGREGGREEEMITVETVHTFEGKVMLITMWDYTTSDLCHT